MSAASDCLFCKMISGGIPVPKLYEDDGFICIRDIRPQAKTHLLVIPKQHVDSLDTAFPVVGKPETALVGKLFEIGTKIARQQGLLPGGFRAMINTNEEGGQTVFHIHLHILGGSSLQDQFG